MVKRRITAAFAAIALLGALTGCGGADDSASEAPATTAAPPKLRAYVTVAFVNTMASVDNALGNEGSPKCNEVHPGIGLGEAVTLRDSDDSIVGVVELGPPGLKPDGPNVCAYSANFVDVPAGGRFYTAEVGGFTSAPVAEDSLDTQSIVIKVD